MNTGLQRSLWRDAVALDRSKFNPLIASKCVLAIAAIVIAGYMLDQPTYAIVAAGGALSVGFGVYQQFSTLRIAPMALAGAGMAISAIFGSVIGQYPDGYVAAAAFWGLLTGLGSILGTGGWWIATQWAIALLVAGSYPSDFHMALMRGFLVLAGGIAQIVIVGLVMPVRERLNTDTMPFEASLRSTFLEGLRARKSWVFAIRSALTMLIACQLYQQFHIPNGYWIPVTAIILLKPEFRETLTRSIARSGGTLLGAGLATLLVAFLRPGEESLMIMVIVFAWFSYAFVQVNYALFALCLTAYIVFLIGLAHLPPLPVVTHRILATATGGVLAVLAHIIPVPLPNGRTSA